ncbi:MAG: hypothetical protein NT038_06725 [Euryarchaeota archaeon]|nr:hypothetical protein [Euryarchaeota archaeon]
MAIEKNTLEKTQESAFVHVYSCDCRAFLEYHDILYSTDYSFSAEEKNIYKDSWKQEQWENISAIEHHVDVLDKNRKKNPEYFYRFYIHTKRSSVGKKVDRILVKHYG